MTRFNRIFLMGFAVVAISFSQARADILNGSFENFFGGWTQVGPNSVTTGIAGVSPTDGSRMAYLNNDSVFGLGLHDFILSNDPQVGLAPGGLTSTVTTFYPGAGNGATLFQTFSMGDIGDTCTIEFDWNFLTNEGQNNDFGFFALASGGAITHWGSLDVANATLGASSPYAFQSGWQTQTITGLSAGTYSLIFGVFHNGPNSVTSGLLVDNIQCECVPEPSSAILLGLASMGVAGFRRRRA